MKTSNIQGAKILLMVCMAGACTGPQVILKLDNKWCRAGSDPHIGRQMIPTKNMEWHGFISEEGENI